MQYATGVITDGFKQLLNGRMKPSAVVKAFQYEKLEVFHALREVPSTAEAYIEADPEARQRWAWLIDYIRQHADDDPDAHIRNIYSTAFYKLDNSLFPPFHILSLYYRTVIYCESRMILCNTSYWLNELELSHLKYEYYTLKYHLIDLLKTTDTDLKRAGRNPEALIDQLERYIKQLLRETLIILLLELSRRYEHLLTDAPVTEEKLITEDKIYLEYLGRPVPDSPSWYITPAGVKDKLKKLQPPKDYLQKALNLLTDVRNQISAAVGEAAKTELNNAAAVIEDTWLCGYLLVMPGRLQSSALGDIDGNTQWLTNLNESLEKPDEMKPKEKDAVNRLVRQKSKIMAALGEKSGANSAARELIRKADYIFLKEDTSIAAEPEELYQPNLAEDYVTVKKIAEDFAVSERTVNNRIEEHKIKFLPLGNHRWLKKNEFERLKSLLIKNRG